MISHPAAEDAAVAPPAGVTSLPPEHLACIDCGVAVAPPHAPDSVETVTAYAVAGAVQLHALRNATLDFEMTCCPACAERRDYAHTLLEAHPSVRAGIGSMSIALHQAAGALSALAVIGMQPPTIRTRGELAALLDALTIVGLGARWSTWCSPVLGSGITRESCAAEPWSHVGADAKSGMRDAYGSYLRRCVEVPRGYRPPIASAAALAVAERSGEVFVSEGCLACGVGSVLALPSRSHEVWTVATISPVALGGRAMGGKRIAGYLCGACARATEEIGAFGPTAWGVALLAHLKVPRRAYIDTQLDDIVGWGVQAANGQRRPNREPWEHLAGLDELREALA